MKHHIILATGALFFLAGCGAAAADSTTTDPGAVATADGTAYAAMVSGDETALSADLSSVTNTPASVTSVCTAVIGDAQKELDDIAAYGAIPSQFAASNTLVARAMNDYLTGCNDAITGISTDDVATVNAGTALIQEGTSLTQQATAALGS